MKCKDQSTEQYVKLACAILALAAKDSRRPHCWQARRWLRTTGKDWMEVLDINIDIEELLRTYKERKDITDELE